MQRRQVNFWATAETIAAILLFGYVSFYWGTLFLLYSSLVIAPLLLMRSPESIARATNWFDNGLMGQPAAVPSSKVGGYAWAAGVGIAIAVGYALVGPGEHDATDLQRLARLFWLGYLTSQIVLGFALLVLLVAYGQTGPIGSAFGPSVFVAVSLLCATALGAGIETGRLDVLLVLGVSVVSLVAAARMPGAGSLLALLLFAPAFASALCLQAIVVRFLATARHAREGFKAMPENIKRLAFMVGPGHVPELIPGLPETHQLSLNRALAETRQTNPFQTAHDFFLFAFLLLMLSLLFLPGWVYRVILKSTLWLWWILLAVAGAPDTTGGVAGLRADAYLKFNAVISIVTSITVIAFFLATSLFMPWLTSQIDGAPLPPAILLLFYVDWKAISLLQAATLLAACLTIFIVLQANALKVDEGVPGRERKVQTRLKQLGYVVRMKRIAGWISIAALMAYVVLYANAMNGWLPVPDQTHEWLRAIYGSNAEALHRLGESAGAPAGVDPVG